MPILRVMHIEAYLLFVGFYKIQSGVYSVTAQILTINCFMKKIFNNYINTYS